MISIANFLALLDSIAKQREILDGALGTPSAASTVRKGIQDNANRVKALSSIEELDELLMPFHRPVGYVLTDRIMADAAGESIRALNGHAGGLDNFLSTNDSRVHEYAALVARNVGYFISASRVMAPQTDVATFDVTGAGAGTFTDTGSVDTNKYGKAPFVLETTVAIGATQIDATLTMVKLDGTTENKVVSIPASSANGTVIDIGVAGDMYIDCSGITITGGSAGDAFKVRSKLERTIAL
jgi:hypothetical protein